jgi:spore coat protein U-like protein
MRVCIIVAGLLTAAPLSMAAQVTIPFTVSAMVVRGCAVSATDLVFGNYLATAAPPTVLATSTISVTCELGDSYTIGLSDGANVTGTQRRLLRTAPPAAYLNYNLFQDAALTQVWRDTGPTRLPDVGTGLMQVHTVYGQIPGGQIVPVGAYIDTVTVTVRN